MRQWSNKGFNFLSTSRQWWAAGIGAFSWPKWQASYAMFYHVWIPQQKMTADCHCFKNSSENWILWQLMVCERRIKTSLYKAT